jgi:acetate kinase
MMETQKYILTVNGGSSSIKFGLFETNGDLGRIYGGSIEGIGLPKGKFSIKGLNPDHSFQRPVPLLDRNVAVQLLMDWMNEQIKLYPVAAIGHRIVHGGPEYMTPQAITPEMTEELSRLSSFDPEHLPVEILLAETFRNRFPNLLHIACFDTEFHKNMPRVATWLPIPRKYHEKGIRRYGFHGLSCAYIMHKLEQIEGLRSENSKIIIAHLGNGASLTAVLNGRSIDTTMAFTPASGLVMGTRSGDIDPGLISYLARTEQINPLQFNHMINHESGLLGISGTTSDMKELLELEASDTRASDAIDLFCYQVKKWIGAYTAILGGLDTLVFTGGIGENSYSIRARICEGLGLLGIELDEAHNKAHADVVSSATGKVIVRVVHTDEELMMASYINHILTTERKNKVYEHKDT